MNIVYVVLHYMAGKDTRECVDSILSIAQSSSYNIDIVIVDNASTNDSFYDLQKTYANNDKIVLIQNEKNLGFAKGNNIGFSFAKHKLKADFIIMLNNDTIIRQKDFNEKLIGLYHKEKYWVLGPDILTADGYHQNPGKKQSWTFKELLLFRFKKRIQLLLSYFNHINTANETNNGINYSKYTLNGTVKNTILHGACLIFSPDYINSFEGIYDGTFLYMEEDILKLYADYYEFLMIYSSEINIYHKEDASTNMVSGTSLEKYRKKNNLLIASSKIYSRLKFQTMLKKFFLSFIKKIVNKIKKTTDYELDYDLPLSYLIDLVIQRFIMLLRGKIISIRFKSVGKNLFVGKETVFKCKNKIQVGSGVTFQDKVYIDALSRQGFKLGNGCSIGTGTIIRCSGNYKKMGVGFIMGDCSSLGDNCFVGATGGVWIGDNVIGGQNIRFHSSNHIFSNTKKLIKDQGVVSKGIHIGNNCWIGAGVTFCDGISIEDGCVIGTNAVVTKSFPKNSIIAGVPAKIIGIRKEKYE